MHGELNCITVHFDKTQHSIYTKRLDTGQTLLFPYFHFRADSKRKEICILIERLKKDFDQIFCVLSCYVFQPALGCSSYTAISYDDYETKGERKKINIMF